MGARPRFVTALPLIADYLERSKGLLFTRQKLATIFAEQRNAWRLPKAMLAREFIEKLVEQTLLASISVDLPAGSRTFYYKSAITLYQLALGLVPHSYLSHQSALYILGLLPTAPPHLYVNQEQSAKPVSGTGPLTQAAVDAAFAKPQRQPQNQTIYQDHTLVFLNGQSTGHLGVQAVTHQEAGEVLVTSMERTLLDITVRPAYAGGVANVLQAYQAAAPLLSGQQLEALMVTLGYRYPYHQAIGFYLERAGAYASLDIQRFARREKALDFYLAHAMGAVAYSRKWRLYYPAELGN